MSKNVGYMNPTAEKIKAKISAELLGEDGLLTLAFVLDKLSLEDNRSNQILVGNAMKKCGFRKVRTHPDKKYFYIRGDELCQLTS